MGFELVFGRFVSGAGWESLLADYDALRGRLWAFVLASVLLAPWLWGRLLASETRSVP